MEQTLFPSPHVFLTLTILIFLFPSIATQTCQKTCGDIPLRYPFGSGIGCGDRRFHRSIACNDHQQLILTTHSGCYPVSYIDYANQVVYISDPTMSTCKCKQGSKGFSLDWDAPFRFQGDTIFALLDCSSSSPVYTPNGTMSLCDNGSQETAICGFLYGCNNNNNNNKGIVSNLNKVPMMWGCCVYTAVNLGPSFEMDLEKLKCGSYSGVYSFNGKQSHEPETWKYGIALKYKFGIDEGNVYPNNWCSSCEQSGGVCGYSSSSSSSTINFVDSFICNCPPGFNTTTNCFFGASLNAAVSSNQQPWNWLNHFMRLAIGLVFF